MAEDYSVRRYRLGYEDEIVQLLELAIEGWSNPSVEYSSLDHWRWKHLCNPLGKSCISVGVSEEHIIGCNHAIPRKVKIGRGCILCNNGVDSAVHPGFRRRGVYSKTLELLNQLSIEDRVKLRYAVTQNPIIIGHRSGDYRLFPHDVMVFVRIQDVDLHLQMMPEKYAMMKSYGFHLAKIYNNLRKILKKPLRSDWDIPIQRINSFTERINVFWKEIRDHYGFIVERTKDYLNWRYCDPRGGDYVVNVAEEDGKTLGYNVLRIDRRRGEYPVGFIVDLLSLPHRLDVAEALLANAVDYFDVNAVNIVGSLVVKRHPYEKIFNSFGFLNSRFKMNICYRLFEEIGEEVPRFKNSSPDRVHFVFGDYDAV